MDQKHRYYIVEASALPEVFLKVVEAKRMLETGEVKTVNDAAIKTGISRSAFYKYRDVVLPFNNMMNGRVITFQMLMRDQPGCLSDVLNIFAEHNANLLSVNTVIPTNGSGILTIVAETINVNVTMEELLQQLRESRGVIKAEILAG